MSCNMRLSRIIEKHLKNPKPIDDLEINPNMTVVEFVDKLGGTAYNARKLSNAAKIWARAIKEKTRIYFTLAGAMTPAGMRRVVAKSMEEGLIDVFVTTGANMVHDALQGMYKPHWIGTECADDVELAKKRIFRIYDVFLGYDEWYDFDEWLETVFYPRFVEDGKKDVRLTPGEIFRELGKELYNRGDRGILATAYKKKIDIYCPAFMDSGYGIVLNVANRLTLKEKYNAYISVDQTREYDNLLKDMMKYENRSVIVVGGGTPKNFTFQTSMSLPTTKDGQDICGFKYAVQITTDSPQWGGLSGATLDEAVSWGKIKDGSQRTIVYSDATLALPLIVTYVLAKKNKKDEKEKVSTREGKRIKLVVHAR